MILQEGLGFMLPGDIMCFEPVLLAQPPVDDPADVVVSRRVPSFCEQFGAAGEKVVDRLDVFVAESAFVIIRQL